MKVIISGSRYSKDYNELKKAIKASGLSITEIVSGNCSGIDTLAIKWANEFKIPCKIFEAEWKNYGIRAGPMRNKKMAEYGEALIAMPGGSGTASMIKEAKRKRLPIYIHTYIT